jgi:hypothetical protein
MDDGQSPRASSPDPGQPHRTLDPSLVDRMGVSYSEVNGGVNQQAIAADEDFFVQVGALKQATNPADIVDSRFAEYALSVLGRYSAAK